LKYFLHINVGKIEIKKLNNIKASHKTYKNDYIYLKIYTGDRQAPVGGGRERR